MFTCRYSLHYHQVYPGSYIYAFKQFTSILYNILYIENRSCSGNDSPGRSAEPSKCKKASFYENKKKNERTKNPDPDANINISPSTISAMYHNRILECRAHTEYYYYCYILWSANMRKSYSRKQGTKFEILCIN